MWRAALHSPGARKVPRPPLAGSVLLAGGGPGGGSAPSGSRSPGLPLEASWLVQPLRWGPRPAGRGPVLKAPAGAFRLRGGPRASIVTIRRRAAWLSGFGSCRRLAPRPPLFRRLPSPRRARLAVSVAPPGLVVPRRKRLGGRGFPLGGFPGGVPAFPARLPSRPPAALRLRHRGLRSSGALSPGSASLALPVPARSRVLPGACGRQVGPPFPAAPLLLLHAACRVASPLRPPVPPPPLGAPGSAQPVGASPRSGSRFSRPCRGPPARCARGPVHPFGPVHNPENCQPPLDKVAKAGYIGGAQPVPLLRGPPLGVRGRQKAPLGLSTRRRFCSTLCRAPGRPPVLDTRSSVLG